MIKGRFPKEIRIIEVRELVPEDIRRLREPRKPINAPRKLRHSHHLVATLDAQGYATPDIVELTGYSATSINLLRKVPAYQMLVAEKAQIIQEKNMDLMAGLMKQKMDLMAAADRHMRDQIEELDEAGELMPIRQALAISADMADRVGFGKHMSQTHMDGDYAKKMERALAESGKVLGQAIAPPRRQSIPDRVGFEEQPPQAVSAGPLEWSGSESPPPKAPLQPVAKFKRRV